MPTKPEMTSGPEHHTRDGSATATALDIGPCPVVPSMDQVSLLSEMTVSWISPLVHLSRRRTIDPEDVPPCPHDLTSSALMGRFAPAWHAELQRSDGPSLLRAMLRVLGGNIIKGAVAMFVCVYSLLLFDTFMIGSLDIMTQP